MLRNFAAIACLSIATFGPSFQPATSPLSDAAQAQTRNRIVVGPGEGTTSRIVNLGLNKSVVVDLPEDAHDILVANPRVADAVTRTSRRLYLFGKLTGQTNVFVFNAAGKQIAALEIKIERDIAGLTDMLEKFIPDSNIRAEIVNDNVVLTGTVPDQISSSRAVSLAEIYVAEQDPFATANQNATAGVFNIFARTEESKIVNLLSIDGVNQVQLRVTLAEIQRSVVKQLGISTNVSRGDNNGFGFNVLGAGRFIEPLVQTSGAVNITSGLNAIQSQISALERAGVMRTLAEPNLTAVSGEEATFQVGGSFQVATTVECSDEGYSITYGTEDYGIALTFTPIVLSAGRISLKIHTEVNEPTAQGAGSVCERAGLPGLRKRLADTTVELPSGGSMVIAGLVQDDVRQIVSGYPGLKNIPVLGSLFRSREYIRNESELVLVVTPYLVKPTARSVIAQPDENFQPASDGAGYFMGRVNRVYGTKQGNLPKGRYTGSIGFILK
ncbi:type II and III secretion system protein family protein [Rhizobiaceae bacterium]|nr:type II and III secretion system protein family protein [Rhizobiaceae bacterium]